MKARHICTDSQLEYTPQNVEGLVHYFLEEKTSFEQLGFNVIQDTRRGISHIIGGIKLSIPRIGILSESHFVEIHITTDGVSSHISEILACVQANGIHSSRLQQIHDDIFMFRKIFEIGGKTFEYIFQMNFLSLLQGGKQESLEKFFSRYHNSPDALFELFPDRDGMVYELTDNNLHKLPWTGVASYFHGDIISTQSIHTYPDLEQNNGGKYAFSSSTIGLKR